MKTKKEKGNGLRTLTESEINAIREFHKLVDWQTLQKKVSITEEFKLEFADQLKQVLDIKEIK